MKIIFPQNINFIFIDHEKNAPICNLVTRLTLFAKEKNNYHVGPKFSDNEGIITFTKKDLKDKINFSQNLFIMDYKSDLEECSRFVEIEVMSKDAIESLILAREKYFSSDKILKLTEDQKKEFRNSSNTKFMPVQRKVDVTDIPEGHKIEVRLIPNNN